MSMIIYPNSTEKKTNIFDSKNFIFNQDYLIILTKQSLPTPSLAPFLSQILELLPYIDYLKPPDHEFQKKM